MGRRSSRRMWHVAAALAPLPLIGLGYASIPGNQLAYRMELLFSGTGSIHALTLDNGAAEHQPLPKAAASLFRRVGSAAFIRFVYSPLAFSLRRASHLRWPAA